MKNVMKKSLGKKLALFAAMVTMVLLFAGSFALEAQAATGKVTATSVNVRKKADKNSTSIGGLLRNDTFTVKGQETGSDGKVWYLIEFGDSQGYVRSDLVSVEGEVGSTGNTSTNTNTNANTTPQVDGVTKLNPVSGTVTGKTVNIRAGAGTGTAKVTSVDKGMVLTIVGQKTGSDNKVWYQVTFISNNKEVTGFIRNDFVDPAGDLTPYTEPVQQPEPSTEPDEPDVPDTPAEPEEPDEPVVAKDWDTVQVDEKWMLVENSSGKYYSVTDLIQISKQNAEKLEAANGTIKGQKLAIQILVIVLVIIGLAVAFVVFRFKDLIVEEILGMKESAPVRKSEPQRKPMPQNGRPGARPEGARPAPRPEGARPAQRPEGARPAQRPEGARPAQRPEGARPAQRPEGARPAQRPEGARPAQRPEGARPAQRPEGARPAQRPEGARPVQRPADGTKTYEMTDSKEAQIRKETNRSLENQQMESKVALNENAKKTKNFMADEDDFEFEFLNWDGDDEE